MEFISSHKTGFLHPLLVLAELYGICSSCCGEMKYMTCLQRLGVNKSDVVTKEKAVCI